MNNKMVTGLVSGALLSLTLLSGCNSNDTNSSSEGLAEVSFNPQFNALIQKTRSARSASLNDLYTGSMEVTNLADNSVQVFEWNVYLEDPSGNGPFVATSNKTISLVPGDYSFNLTLQQGSFTYLGSVIDTIEDNDTDIVGLTIKPVLGLSSTDTNIADRVAEFSFNFPQAELLAVGATHLNVTINSGVTTIFELNTATGVFSENASIWQVIEAGNQTIELELLKDGMSIAHSTNAQEAQTIAYGQGITMDLVPMVGQIAFSIDESGNNATFGFTVPAEIINEAGGVENLDVRFQLSSNKNNTDQLLDQLTVDGNGDGNVSVTLTDFHYDTMNLALTFIDNTVVENIASCTTVAVDLNNQDNTYNCSVSLRRRAEISGSLLTNVALNVYDQDGQPATNASVYMDDVFVGITGSAAQFSTGYLNLFSTAGQHTLSADNGSLSGETALDLQPLSVNNVDLTISPTIVATGGFTGNFAPANWALSGVAAYNMTETALTANVGGGGGGVTASITIPADGTISFDWNMVVNSAGQYGDAIKYVINGTGYDLSTAGSASGSETGIAVTAGDVFEFVTWGTTQSSSYNASFDNFTFN